MNEHRNFGRETESMIHETIGQIDRLLTFLKDYGLPSWSEEAKLEWLGFKDELGDLIRNQSRLGAHELANQLQLLLDGMKRFAENHGISADAMSDERLRNYQTMLTREDFEKDVKQARDEIVLLGPYVEGRKTGETGEDD